MGNDSKYFGPRAQKLRASCTIVGGAKVTRKWNSGTFSQSSVPASLLIANSARATRSSVSGTVARCRLWLGRAAPVGVAETRASSQVLEAVPIGPIVTANAVTFKASRRLSFLFFTVPPPPTFIRSQVSLIASRNLVMPTPSFSPVRQQANRLFGRVLHQIIRVEGTKQAFSTSLPVGWRWNRGYATPGGSIATTFDPLSVSL